MKRASVLAIVLALGLATACAPIIRTHGFKPTPEALARVEAGVDTRGSVRRKIGRPSATGVFDDRGWYYAYTVVEHFAFYEPEVIERTVVAIEFDERDVVASVNSYGMEDGRVIDLATRTTPTHGRELTIIEQLIANLGAIGGEDFFGDN